MREAGTPNNYECYIIQLTLQSSAPNYLSKEPIFFR